jgi:hypothetical protein
MIFVKRMHIDRENVKFILFSLSLSPFYIPNGMASVENCELMKLDYIIIPTLPTYTRTEREKFLLFAF